MKVIEEKNITLFKTIFEQTPISTQVFTPDGKTLMVNKAWEELWNVKFELVKSYNILQDKQLVETGTMPYIIRGFKGEVVSIPAVKYDPSRNVPIKKATIRWLSARMYPIRNEKDKITHLVLQHEDITEQKRVEDEKQKFISLIENSSDFIGITDEYQQAFYVNKAGQKLVGLDGIKEVKKKKVLSFFPPSEKKRVINEIMPILLKEGSWSGETQFRNFKTKELIPVLWNVFIIRDKTTGKIQNFACVSRDITERKHFEEGLKESQAMLRATWESATDAMVLSDKNGFVIDANPAYFKLYGYSQNEIIGKRFSIIFPKKFRKQADIAYKKTFTSNVKQSIVESKVLSKDNKEHIVESKYSFIMKNGVRVAMLSVIRDISEQKKSETALRESEERLRIALDAGKIGVWDWDIENEMLTWTENVYKIHDVNKKTFEVTYKNFLNLIHPDDKNNVTKAIAKSLRDGTPFSMQFRIVTRDGSVRWVATNAVSLYGTQNKPIRLLGATSDITEQKHIEQEKSDFLSMAAHELKTPITSMKMFVELLYKELLDLENKKSLYFAKRIKDQTNRLTELTNDLLDVSRIETGKLKLNKETFDLYDLIKEALEGLQATTKQKLLLRCDKETIIVADKYRIYQVVINLVTNAMKYSPPDKNIIISVRKKENEIITCVKDYGIGIAKEKHAKIFDRLYQVTDPNEKTFPGLGLGLNISKEIIERHKGKIWLKSEKKKGSRFYFSLPISKHE